MAITYGQAPATVLSTAGLVIDQYHQGLEDARIGFVMRQGGTDGLLAKAAKVSPQVRVHVDLDLIVWIDEDAWNHSDGEQRKALLDHALSQIEQGEGGWVIVKPDIVEFSHVIKRWGLWNKTLFRLSDAMQPHQLRLEGMAPSGRGLLATITPETMAKVGMEGK